MCEIQLNIDAILVAKEATHGYYEDVRSAIPDLCKGAPVGADELQEYITNKLDSSALDVAVQALERTQMTPRLL